jgi:hypothetical protein
MTNTTGIISALALLYVHQLQGPPERAGGVRDDPGHCLDDDKAAAGKCQRKAQPKTGPPEALDVLAYTTKQAAQVTGRSHTRIKLAIRQKEITARKDRRATIIERAELQRWIASLPTIGRKPEPAQAVQGPHEHAARMLPTPQTKRRSAVANAHESARR